MDHSSEELLARRAEGHNSLATDALAQAYNVLAILIRHCGDQAAALLGAMQALEQEPASEGRRLILRETNEEALAHAGATPSRGDEAVSTERKVNAPSGDPARSEGRSLPLITSDIFVGANSGQVTGTSIGTLNADTRQTAFGNNNALAAHGGNAIVKNE